MRQHDLGNILESDLNIMKRFVPFFRHQSNLVRHRSRLDDSAVLMPVCMKMVQQREDCLLRIHPRSICINDAAAVGISVGRDADK